MSHGSRSSSSSSTNTSTFNLGLQDTAGPAVAAVGGQTTIISTDQGAVAAGREIALQGIQSAESGLNEVVNAGRDVLAAGGEQNRVVANTLSDIARDQTQFAESVASEAQAGADRARSDTLAFAGDTIGDVLSGVAAARGDIIGLADRSRDFAGDTVSSVLSDAAGARGDVIGLADRTTGQVIGFAGDTVGNLLAAESGGRADLLAFAGDTERDVIDAASSFLDRTIAAVQTAGQGFVNSASDLFARQSTNTDARLESVSKYALLGAAVIGGAALLVPLLRK